MDFAYMDNASGTRLLDEVFDEMAPFFKTEFGNPSSIHTAGSKPKAAVEHAREQVANLIGAQPKEIYFTSCGTESNNFAIKGAAFAQQKKVNILSFRQLTTSLS